jgi:hypothetical protein
MVTRVQTLRSSTSGLVPTAGSRQPGELWVNFPDLQLGLIDASRNAQKLLPVRYFSASASYAAGEVALQAGALYIANGAISPGAFNGTQWTKVAVATDITGSYLPSGGGTLTGPLILNADPTLPLGAVTKQYSDTHLSKAGGTMTGAITLAADPAAALQPATKQYVDAKGGVSNVATALGLAGGPITSTGTLTLDASYFPGFLTGLAMSYVNTTTFGVATGMASDAPGNASPTYMMRLAVGGISKTLSAWAVGNGNGALDTGSIGSNTWYYVWLICRPDTGVVDILLSGSLSAPVMPTNYTKKRRIGAIRTNGSSQITPFSQLEDEFSWNSAITDYSTTTLGTTTTPVTLNSVPPLEAPAVWRGYCYMNSGTAGAYVTVTNGNGALCTMILVPTASAGASQQLDVLTNNSAQINVVSNIAATTLNLYTFGWKDRRGRF